MGVRKLRGSLVGEGKLQNAAQVLARASQGGDGARMAPRVSEGQFSTLVSWCVARTDPDCRKARRVAARRA